MPTIKPTHNLQLNISIGRSRRETSWKNKRIQWGDLLTKVSTTHRTAETHAEYMAAKKPRQDEIKDVGGFVGAYLTGGRRKASNVLHRQLITLDIDFGTAEFWNDFILFYGNTACIYSTHKHSPDKPRLRLLMPLDREVFPDQYEAIARHIAGSLDIELFDPTTFQPERLMYWPSTSSDGEYIFHWQDGPPLSADAVLSSYVDWRDASEWPISAKVNKAVNRAITKQGDPLEKPGVIGAFCRTYDVHQVIEQFLHEQYEACADGNRYTYKGGSTAAGLVVYDDKFAYSHHGTDPISSTLCNAFDLVRVHLFGLKDEDVTEGTPTNKKPSYAAMQDFAAALPEVRKLLTAERIREAAEDFKDLDLVGDDLEWTGLLEVDRRGVARSTIDNIVIILENAKEFKDNLIYDDFAKKRLVARGFSWRRGKQLEFLESDLMNVEHYMEHVHKISNSTKIQKALAIVFDRHRFHPVRDYLKGLQWDGVPRLETLLVDYLGVKDSTYARAVTRKTLCGAIARVFKPGCKYDYVLTFVGDQGLGKSTLIRKLGGDWFSDNFTTVQGKESFEQLQGYWLIEIGELAGLRKAEVETIKHYITKQSDYYRPAYARMPETFPRQCIFLASTNKRDFLRDNTGNRRFWPVMCGSPGKNLFTELDADTVRQIWAEAMQYYKNGEALYLNKELESIARMIQEEHSEQDDRAGIIGDYLEKLLPDGWNQMSVYQRRNWLSGDETAPVGIMQRRKVCVAEIWCEALGLMVKDMTYHNTKPIHDLMRTMRGWEAIPHVSKFGVYGNQRGYKRVKNQVNANKNSVDLLR